MANYGHLVVGIFTTEKFRNYKSGIFTENVSCFTGLGNMNHAVVIVGYDLNKKFWIIRNSWVSIFVFKSHILKFVLYNCLGHIMGRKWLHENVVWKPWSLQHRNNSFGCFLEIILL
jgi:hypothetical protein